MFVSIFYSFGGSKTSIKGQVVMEYDFINKTILVVEDEESSRFLFEKTLKKTRAHVLYVNNGAAAINLLKGKSDIDVVLMDIRLPVMDGFAATHLIKELNPELPVIIQTAYDISAAREEAGRSGCDDFITKPIHTDALLSILKKYLKN